MTDHTMHRGHRHFRLDNDGLCVDDTRHVPGDRHWDIGVCDDEWTGEVSARVCPVDDIPILGHDERGWSCCERCGLKAVDVPVRTEAPW